MRSNGPCPMYHLVGWESSIQNKVEEYLLISLCFNVYGEKITEVGIPYIQLQNYIANGIFTRLGEDRTFSHSHFAGLSDAVYNPPVDH